MNVAVAYEGVLVRSDDSNTPNLEAVDVIRSLTVTGRVVVCSEAPVERVERFLGTHRIDGVAEIISGSERPGDDPLFVRQVAQHRAGGARLDSVVFSDPTLIKWALEARLACYLFLAPWTVPPKFYPGDDKGRQTWDQIEADLDTREVPSAHLPSRG